MKIRILSGHCLGGGVDVFPGDVVDRPEFEARWKISRGWAEPVVEEQPAEPAPEAKGKGQGDPPADPAVLAPPPEAEEQGDEPDEEEQDKVETPRAGARRRGR